MKLSWVLSLCHSTKVYQRLCRKWCQRCFHKRSVLVPHYNREFSKSRLVDRHVGTLILAKSSGPSLISRIVLLFMLCCSIIQTSFKRSPFLSYSSDLLQNFLLFQSFHVWLLSTLLQILKQEDPMSRSHSQLLFFISFLFRQFLRIF